MLMYCFVLVPLLLTAVSRLWQEVKDRVYLSEMKLCTAEKDVQKVLDAALAKKLEVRRANTAASSLVLLCLLSTAMAAASIQPFLLFCLIWMYRRSFSDLFCSGAGPCGEGCAWRVRTSRSTLAEDQKGTASLYFGLFVCYCLSPMPVPFVSSL
jgi:hypothetical protein